MTDAEPSSKAPAVDWEAFYRSYRTPGYVPGFEITSKLGGGMFGLVFKAKKQSIGRTYAIKFLKVDDESVREAVVRLTGLVPSETERDMAEFDAWYVFGVDKVINEIEVRA